MNNPKPKSNWRLKLRGVHRDAGFLVVGFTLIYALSGLAVNHVNDWNPSFSAYSRVVEISRPLPEDDDSAVSVIVEALELDSEPDRVYVRRDIIERIEVTLKDRVIEIRPDEGDFGVVLTGQEPETVYDLPKDLPKDPWTAASVVVKSLKLSIEGMKVETVKYPVRDLELTWKHRQVRVQDYQTGAHAVEEGEKARPVLRVLNWLHLNRGKKAWVWFADSYAIILLFLAISGTLMVPGKKGLIGRGGVFLLIGLAVPVLYLVIWGRP
ncbi:MAG: PepSY-associated TM helix domain-containing protein [Planctomycetota bacterium]